MLNAETLRRINSSIKTTLIKGKDYAPIAERVRAFRDELFDWRIITSIVSFQDQEWVIKAEILDPTGDTMATGYASEKVGSSNINRTSALENAETSAVGRALGFLGIGITESIASADEVKAAIEHQEQNEQPADDLAELWKKCLKAGISKDGLNGWYIANGYEGRKLGELDAKERKHVESYLNDMLKSAERLRNEH